MRCPKCYYNNPPDANFCARCGIPLFEVKGGERRRGAILFADISGFSLLAKSLDPEVLRDLIDRSFSELTGIIHKYEGTIDKIIGDCIMALFGVPKSYEDTPLRAVMTALELQEKFKELAQKEKKLEASSIRVGVNYGLVVTGTPGQPSAHTVMGDAVVLAERLQTAAPPGKIYVSESVYRNTNKEVEYQLVSGIKLKGRRESANAYIPLRLITKVAVRRLEEAKMIGRKKELNALLAACKSIEGKGKLVSISGEPGIGKSKLLLEFKRLAKGGTTTVIEARGVLYSKDSPYIVLRGIIEELVKERSELPGLIKYFLGKEVPANEQESIEVMNPEDRKNAIEQGLLKLINESKELIFILDDAHWIDGETLRFFLKVVKELPILCVVSYRPCSWVEEILNSIPYSRIPLHQLTDEEILTLALDRLNCKEIEKGLSAFLISKSGGNPFYIEELIASLLDEQRIEFQNGVAGKKGKPEIPDKISNLITSRIDRLSEEQQSLLETASIIGMSFSIELLSKLIGKDPTRTLHHLKEKGYLMEEVLGTTYTFKHQLVREAIYETLLVTRRSNLHKKVATLIEELYTDRLEEFLEPLTYHYREAGEIEKAIAYSERGGDRKRELCLNKEAITAYKSCIDLILKSYKERDRLFELYKKLSKIYESLGEYGNATRSCEEGLEYSRTSASKSQILCMKARIFLQVGNLLKAQEFLNHALTLAEKGTKEWGWIRVYEAQLDVLFSNLHQASEKALEVLNTTDSKGLSQQALRVMAIVCEYEGKEKEAIRYREKILASSKKVGNKEKLRADFDLLDKLYSESPDKKHRRLWFELNFGLWEVYMGKPRLAKDALLLGEFYYDQGKLDKALPNYKKSLELWEGLGNKTGMCISLFLLGKAYQEGELYKEALSSYEQCISILKENGRNINIPEVQSAKDKVMVNTLGSTANFHKALIYKHLLF